MVIIHFAATFDSGLFHEELATELVKHNTINLDRLREIAKSKVDNASESLKHILDITRYDDDWFEDSDHDHSNAYLWYSICLFSVLEVGTSLTNNRFQGSHYVLETMLPVLGWTIEETSALIHGKPLEDLLYNTKYKIFGQNLTLYGGCLSSKNVALLLDKLRSIARDVANNNTELDKMIKIKEFAYYNHLDVPTTVEYALSDASDMLQTAQKQNKTLYLVRVF